MKSTKCVVCLKTKGKRVCQINDNALICPRCCAEIRNPDCEGCFYYAQAEQYETGKTRKKKTEHFIMRVDPEVDEAINQALGMMEAGNRAAGEAIITDLFKQHPDLYMVHYGMGVVHAMREQLDEALPYFDKAIEIFPYCVEAWFNKAVCYQKKLKVEKMLEAFQKVIELGDPKDDFVLQAKRMISDFEATIKEDLGITLDAYLEAADKFQAAFAKLQQSDWQQALVGFQQVVALNPKHPQSYGNMGICHAQLGRRQEALDAFDKALDIDPTYEPAIANRLAVETLKEGEKPVGNKFSSVEYYKDFPMQKQSLLERMLGIFKA